ncbi:MAG: LptF/LptG family permease, partial [Lentisphaeria bacterium]
MKTVNRYITIQLISTFIATLSVLTFIMLAAGMVSGVELLAKGVNFSLFAEFVGYRMPKALGLAIPMSILTSTILLFSRLSADNEITAMRAGGISVWQIITPCLAFSAVLSAFCFWLQSEVIPVT